MDRILKIPPVGRSQLGLILFIEGTVLWVGVINNPFYGISVRNNGRSIRYGMELGLTDVYKGYLVMLNL